MTKGIERVLVANCFYIQYVFFFFFFEICSQRGIEREGSLLLCPVQLYGKYLLKRMKVQFFYQKNCQQNTHKIINFIFLYFIFPKNKFLKKHSRLNRALVRVSSSPFPSPLSLPCFLLPFFLLDMETYPFLSSLSS